MIVTCARCLADWPDTEIGNAVRLAGTDPDNDDYFCMDEAACGFRMDRLLEDVDAI